MTHRRLTTLLTISTSLLIGCPDEAVNEFDFDGDGVYDAEDCAPEDADIYPGADDVFGDGIDQDCDECDDSAAGDGVDTDCDGYPANDDLEQQHEHLYDCNDEDHLVNPGMDEVSNNGVDDDCDGVDCTDEDGDGACEGIDDCDDEDEDRYLDNPEVADGKDNDCDGTEDEGTQA